MPTKAKIVTNDDEFADIAKRSNCLLKMTKIRVSANFVLLVKLVKGINISK